MSKEIILNDGVTILEILNLDVTDCDTLNDINQVEIRTIFRIDIPNNLKGCTDNSLKEHLRKHILIGLERAYAKIKIQP